MRNKLNSRKFGLWALSLALFVFGCALWSTQAQAEQPKEYCQSNSGTWDQRDPLFDNVKRVVIFVDTPSYLDNVEGQEKLPEPFKKDQLRELLKQLYTKRYTRDGRGDTQTVGCYNRLDQRVLVMSDADIKAGKHIKLSKEDGTLTVYLQIFLTSKGFKNNAVTEDIVTMSLVHYRPEPDISIFRHGVKTFSAFPLTIPEEKLAEMLRIAFKGQIR